MAIGDVYVVRIKQRLHNQDVINVLHYKQSAGQPDSQAGTLATAVATNIVSKMKPLQASELSHVGVEAQRVWPQPAGMAASDTSANGTGTAIGDSLPSSVAVVFTKRTLFAGRKFRGRMYLGGIPLSAEANSQITPAYEVQALALQNQIPQDLTSGTNVFDPVILHANPPGTTTEINSALVRVVLRNQRRRQVGRGN